MSPIHRRGDIDWRYRRNIANTLPNYGDPGDPLATSRRHSSVTGDLRFTVIYRPGANNPADILSRQPLRQTESEAQEQAHAAFAATIAVPNGISQEAMLKATQEDLALQAARQSLCTGRWCLKDAESRSLYTLRHELSEAKGLLLRGDRLVMPTSLRQKSLQLAHTGHMGIKKTSARLQTKVWWPGMTAAAEAMVRACTLCAACSNQGECKATPLQPTQLPEGAWLSLGVDFLGPIQGQMVMVVIDHYSRFPVVQVLQNTDCAMVLRKLDSMFKLLGRPLEVTSDNGPPFSAKDFSDGLANLGVRHRRITPLHPEANGLTERLNRGLNKAIRAAVSDGNNWKEAVEDWLMAYRLTPHSSTGLPPADLMFGRKVNGPIPCWKPSAPLSVSRKELHQRDAAAKARMKSYADASRGARPHQFKVGDLVLQRKTQ